MVLHQGLPDLEIREEGKDEGGIAVVGAVQFVTDPKRGDQGRDRIDGCNMDDARFSGQSRRTS